VPNIEDPADFEATIALTGDDLKPVSFNEEDDAVTGRRPVGRRDGESTGELRDTVQPGPPPFPPPPFPSRGLAALTAPPTFAEPAVAPPAFVQAAAVAPPHQQHVAPVAEPREETVTTAKAGAAPRSEFAPISTFVAEPPRPSRSTRPAAPEPVAAASPMGGRPPQWVVGYLVLCAVLTLVGLCVIFFEHRLL